MAERFGKGYDNIDDAAAAALMALSFQPRVKNQEYMGLLVQDPVTGQIYRTGFQTEGKQMSSSWTGTPDGRVVGVAHNHPMPRAKDRYPHTNFSLADIDTATDLKVPSYIAAMQSVGPSQDRKFVQTGGITGGGAGAPGQEFLAQFPIDEMLQQMARTNPMTAAYLQQKRAGGDLSPIAAAARVTEMMKMPTFNVSASAPR